MAFVNRRKQNIETTPNQQNESGSKENSSKQIIANLTPKRETYLDMTIEVLNILEKQGINVFDKNRVGGMYQRRGQAQQIAVKNLTESVTKKITGNDDTPSNETPINSLLNFFKNKNQ